MEDTPIPAFLLRNRGEDSREVAAPAPAPDANSGVANANNPAQSGRRLLPDFAAVCETRVTGSKFLQYGFKHASNLGDLCDLLTQI